jgi:hypothetical protein
MSSTIWLIFGFDDVAGGGGGAELEAASAAVAIQRALGALHAYCQGM